MNKESYMESDMRTTLLFAVICNQNKDKAWKTRKFFDGSPMPKGYFLVGLNAKGDQWSYYYLNKYWSKFLIPEIETTPEIWDANTAENNLDLISLIK